MSAHKPSDVAAQVGASESFIRDLARRGLVEHIRVGRNAIRFTDEQVAGVVTYLTQPADTRAADPGPIRARRRRTA